MRSVIHFILTIVSFCIVPLMWLVYCLQPEYRSLRWYYSQWNEHRKSGESWGSLD